MILNFQHKFFLGTLALSVKTGRKKDDIQHFIILSKDGAVALGINKSTI